MVESMAEVRVDLLDVQVAAGWAYNMVGLSVVAMVAVMVDKWVV